MSTKTGADRRVSGRRSSSKTSGKTANPVNATEVYSWGSDMQGQLGLGLMAGQSNNLQPAPKYCTYGITIREVACGQDHTAFITNDNFLYSIGSNLCGQLGVGDAKLKIKNSPILVEHFVNNQELIGVMSVSCGDNHTIISTLSGHVFSWGQAKYGALGIGGCSSDQFSP
jgi:alpha-tubulin suppressor-like RCC1 family protein